MAVERPTDGWQILRRNIARYKQELESLDAIAEIVAEHPEWAEEEPALKKHLKVLFGDEEPN